MVEKPKPKKAASARKVVSSSDSEDEEPKAKKKTPVKKVVNKKPATKQQTPAAKKVADIPSDHLEDEELQDVQFDANIFTEVLKNLQQAESLSAARINEETNKPSSSNNQDLTSEISSLLLQGESNLNDNDESDEDGFEELEQKPAIDEKYEMPKIGITVTLPGTELYRRRKKNCTTNFHEELRKKLNQRIRSKQVLLHKVGLLCCLAHGFSLNQIINNPDVLSAASKVLTHSKLPKKRTDLNYLTSYTTWFSSTFSLNKQKKTTGKDKQLVSSGDKELDKENQDPQDIFIDSEVLISRLKGKCARSNLEMVMLYVAMLRSIGLHCRLVVSLFPPRLKPRKSHLFPTKLEKQKNGGSTKEESDKKIKDEESIGTSKKPSARKRKAVTAKKPSPKKAKADCSEDESDNEEETKPAVATRLRRFAATPNKKQTAVKQGQGKKKTLEQKEESDKSAQKKRKLEEESDWESESVQMSSDDDFEEKKPVAKKIKINETKSKSRKSTGPRKQTAKKQNVPSDDDEVTEEKLLATQNYWAEVYLESEENWISVSVTSAKVHCIAEIFKKSLSPMLYVVAWNSGNKVKDVTRRYSPNWLKVTRKLRVEEKWWDETLSIWKEEDSVMSKAEDEFLTQKELDQPLPKTISECKGHPLYVLQRHLLKFEAIYPPDAVPVGHLPSKEPIYSRTCVYTLMSRETWNKKARVVKPNQEAYKVVKALPKYDKLSGAMIKDLKCDLFGIWQTDEFVPPEAKDGKVPRNEYGTVDLFMDKMLPKGCVHIKLPALNRVAKKLNIDCAQACVGFNFKAHGAVPAYEGYVVCEEFERILIKAWEEDQTAAEKRANERREQRIFGNWRKLIRGMMIKQRLAAKYEVTEDTGKDDEKPSTSAKRGKQKKK